MPWLTGVAVYIVIWWTALFVVLPWNVKSPDVPEGGQAGGAPDNPQLLRKFLVTTVLSAIIWIIIFVLIKSEIIDFYGIADRMMQEDHAG